MNEQALPDRADDFDSKRGIQLQRLADGSFIERGRNASINGVRGDGGARHYSGEAARVLALVLKHPRKLNG